MGERAWDTAVQPAEKVVSPGRVLVVDDEPSMRQMLSIALRREGFDVSTAEDGPTALAVLSGDGADVLVTDVRMPEMSGVELLGEARRIDPALTVIMMTAYGSKETVLEALRLGATDYVEKTDKLKDELLLRTAKELIGNAFQQETVCLKRRRGLCLRFRTSFAAAMRRLASFQLARPLRRPTST